MGDSIRSLQESMRTLYGNGQASENHRKNRTDLPEKMQQALLFVADYGESNIYRVKGSCNMGYSTAHNSMKTLENEGFIRLTAVRKNEKGVMAKYYGLTLKGLYHSIYAKSPWHEKVVLAEKRKELAHENFLTWMKFIEALNNPEIEKDINKQFSNAATTSFLFEHPFGARQYYSELDDSIFDLTVMTTLIVNPHFLDRFLAVISNFLSIKTKIHKLITEQMVAYQDDLKKLETIQNGLEGIGH
jgi:predicted transcriptional regulator